MSAAIAIGRADDFAPGTAKRVEINGHHVAIVRIGEDFYALGDTCTHADYSLAQGEIDADERAIECWKHGALFSLETGEALTLPATRATPVYEVVVDDDGELKVVITGE